MPTPAVTAGAGFRCTTHLLPLLLHWLSPQLHSRRAALDVHEFTGQFQGQQSHFKMTSVIGHVYNLDFPAAYNSWDRVDPLELFDAQTVKGEANPKVKLLSRLACVLGTIKAGSSSPVHLNPTYVPISGQAVTCVQQQTAACDGADVMLDVILTTVTMSCPSFRLMCVGTSSRRPGAVTIWCCGWIVTERGKTYASR